jgi:hypothetical protein
VPKPLRQMRRDGVSRGATPRAVGFYPNLSRLATGVRARGRETRRPCSALSAHRHPWSSGPSCLRPLSIVPPRLARLGVKADW